MVAIDGAGFDWSYMADDEVPIDMALMVFSDSEVHNDKTCSKTYPKSFETLKTQLDNLRIEFNKSEFNLATYKRGLASVGEQLIFYKKNEVLFCEQLAVLKRDISYKDSEISVLKSELEKLKQEKESNQLKIEKFDNASKSLDKLIRSQIPDKSRKGLGFVSYNVVPPPPTGLFSPPNLDLSNSGLEEFQQPEFEGYGPKTSKSVSEDTSNEVRESPDASLVEELVSNDKLEKKTFFPTVAKINFVRPQQQEKPVRKPCHPQKEDQGYVDSGRSRHMTGNMSYLSDFKDLMEDMLHLGEEPKEEELLLLQSSAQTRRMINEQGFISVVYEGKTHEDLHTFLFACFLSQEEPKKVIQALKDPSWIEAMQEELLQFKLQQVWTLVDLPYGKRAIGTTWVYRNKKDERVMHKKFQMSSMGELTFFLGLKVTQKDDGIFISQDKLMIGSLMYLTASRPNIMFVVCAYTRFQVTPKVSHLHAVKRIFRYLKGQPKLGLWYPKDSPFDLKAYTDSDYAAASLDKKSTTRCSQFLGKRLISWQCKKQTIVANSTTEAEYVVASSCCGQVLWIENQSLDYGYNFMNIKIFIDNESTIYIVKNPVFYSKTKHIEIRHHFIRDSNEKKLIQMIKIHTEQFLLINSQKLFDVGEEIQITDCRYWNA
ncbi:hypothetical protein Tco_0925378 [Tanacetum coccineum]|uniref:Reverse transcriptase Ty1/copia-type domain-containing protein n=1 Tax=Tanacetum coccineum TaxID=301880 RepID=A0ABQ5DDQ3_9ASTR